MRAIMIFTIIPNTMINAAVVPYCSKAIDIIASLLGTTPCTPKACWKILPNGSNDCVTTLAPALKTKNPRIVFMVPDVISVADFSGQLIQ